VKDDQGFSTFGILASFVLGGLAGATAALLLAPQSGQDSRRAIGRRIRDEVDKGRTAGTRIAGKGRELLDGASSYLGKQVDEQERPHDRHVASLKGEKEPVA